MNVCINKPKKVNQSFATGEIESGDVYDYSGALVQKLESGCFIVYDTNDETLVTFDDSYDLDEWLSDNGYATRGLATYLRMKLVIE